MLHNKQFKGIAAEAAEFTVVKFSGHAYGCRPPRRNREASVPKSPCRTSPAGQWSRAPPFRTWNRSAADSSFWTAPASGEGKRYGSHAVKTRRTP